MCRVLEHAGTCHSRGTWIVPAWRFAPFWPILCPRGQNVAWFIQGTIVLLEYSELIVPLVERGQCASRASGWYFDAGTVMGV